MGHLFISAAHKSSGKTTVSLGLCAAFRERGFAVQAFKKGPDYIDPMWLALASGRPCYNLDFYTQTAPEIRAMFVRFMQAGTLGVIEGNKGLYDGLDPEGSNSNAALAKLLNAPVVLVVDVQGMTRGIAPLLLGYREFDPDLSLAGVILNKVAGQRHEAKLCQAVERYTDVPVIGSVHRSAKLHVEERHLGLMPSNECPRASADVARIGEAIAGQVDLDRLIQIADSGAAQASVIPNADSEGTVVRVRIGIARDAAFGFYYASDLSALEAAGAELVAIDALRDARLPKVDGLFIGGGFPEMQMEALEANGTLRAEIYQAIEGGMPVYAECGGLMYLARSIRWKGRICAMVGIVPGDVIMHERPIGRGYTHLRETGHGLWPLRDHAGRVAAFHGHEFHYSSLENLPRGMVYAFEVLRGNGIDGRNDGIVYKNLLACYSHQRDVAANPWARRFVDFVARKSGLLTGASDYLAPGELAAAISAPSLLG
jgi:cobyrinic acid a,c-diamide synthase